MTHAPTRSTRPRQAAPSRKASVYDAGEESRAITEQIERLFRSQAPRLLRFLNRRASGREDAADLLQESFLRLIRMTQAHILPDRPEAYLQRIASNLLKDRVRQCGARDSDLYAPLDEELIADPAPDAQAVLEAQELLSLYEAALLGLRPKTRQIFLLHRREGLTYAQIATEVGLSVSGVEKHMMRAIAHIDRVLGRI